MKDRERNARHLGIDVKNECWNIKISFQKIMESNYKS